ncbi:hypothetical protein F383_08168 [Gossypium arboreum]|uniref:Uncharacterized protein n=1 Tax=Gossypium arboreum TaxID=29729 RepID=A0A0B0PE20_GOSAR|nr:hypothetical protein F383_08168 [Gossypium arboreum]
MLAMLLDIMVLVYFLYALRHVIWLILGTMFWLN